MNSHLVRCQYMCHMRDIQRDSPPCRKTLDLLHVSNAIRNRTTKRTGERRARQDDSNTHTPLLRTIPKRQIVHQPRKQSRFKHTQQEPHSGNSRIVVRTTKSDRARTPTKHEKSNPATGFQFLQEVVAGYFEHGVRDKEDHERNGVLVVCHVGFLQEGFSGVGIEGFGIADVGSVEEAEEVDSCCEGDDAKVLFPD